MNNGCICCTVRGDLIRILNKLLTRRKKFDAIMIETTGLANPAPVIQTFFVDDDLKDACLLDAVLTVVDAKHVMQHLDEEKPDDVVNEAVQQVAFADKILLNKLDLVSEAEKQAVIRRVRVSRRAGAARQPGAAQPGAAARRGLAAGGQQQQQQQQPLPPASARAPPPPAPPPPAAETGGSVQRVVYHCPPGSPTQPRARPAPPPRCPAEDQQDGGHHRVHQLAGGPGPRAGHQGLQHGQDA